MKRVLNAIFASFCLLTAGFGGEFTGDNFTITPPGDWEEITKQVPRNDVLAAFGKADKTGLLLIKLDEHKLPVPLDDRFAEEFDRGVESGNGGKCISRRFFEAAGVKCYETLCEFTTGGKTVSSVIRVIPFNGRSYQLHGMSFDGRRATENAELQKALDSFRTLAVK